MLDKKFKSLKDRNKMYCLKMAINAKLGFNLNDNIFNDLLDFIDIKKQYALVVFTNCDEFLDNAYDGYNIISDAEKYLISRKNTIPIYGNFSVAYKQNNKIIRRGNILDDNAELLIAIGYTSSKGYTQTSKQAILERSNFIYFLNRRGV